MPCGVAKIEGKKKKVGTRREEAGRREGRVAGLPGAGQRVLSPSGHLVSGMRSKEGEIKWLLLEDSPKAPGRRGPLGGTARLAQIAAQGCRDLWGHAGRFRAEVGLGLMASRRPSLKESFVKMS